MFRSLWQILMGREHQRSKRARRPSPRPVSLTLEDLEGRAVPSVSVARLTDPSGGVGIRVTDSGRNDPVIMTDNSTAVAGGNTRTFDHSFTIFELALKSQNETHIFDPVGDYSQRLADLLVNLGSGQNHFTFNPGLTAITNHSDVNLNVQGHNGNDFASLTFGTILESRGQRRRQEPRRQQDTAQAD